MTQALRIDPEAEQREIELRVAEMTKLGGAYYPYTRDHIVEAVSEMPNLYFKGDDDPFSAIKGWCSLYWRTAAYAAATSYVIRSRP
ncbi:MAG: hypothetical protein ACYCZR_06125 [Burkholderiales bacterium]